MPLISSSSSQDSLSQESIFSQKAFATGTTTPSIINRTQILLTGASGFLGKVVLEELFRRRTELQFGKVFIVLRSKRGKEARTRFVENIVTSPCFSLLPKSWTEDVEVVSGDLSEPECGLDPTLYDGLCQQITHIVHCAGCVRFDSPIIEAANQNINAMLNIHDLAKKCQNLQKLVITSTAYVMPYTPKPIYEKLTPLPMSAEDLYSAIMGGTMKEKEVLKLTGHPNTYALTKCMSEHLLIERNGDLPMMIVRPSIVTGSRKYPMPGWNDSYATIAGVLAALSTGRLKVVDGNPETILDIVAVDDVANHLINEALLIKRAINEPKIVFSVATLKHGLKLKVSCKAAVDYYRTKTVNSKAKLCHFGPRNSRFYFHDFIGHKVTLGLTSILFKLKGDTKTKMQVDRMAKSFSAINDGLSYFMHNNFDFRPATAKPLGQIDNEEFIENVSEGIEKYLMFVSRAKLPS